MSSYFLTTAIDYVNGRPHLGHAYEKVLADAIARYRRNRGDSVFFLTGVDEHGQKVQQSAKALGEEPQAFCDRMATEFRETWEKLEITHDRFVRTTDPAHKKVVREWLQRAHDRDLIFYQEHKGFYSVRQEQFVHERDRVDGAWPEIFGEVVEMSEPNYFFRLSRFQDWLRDFIEQHPDFIVPAFRRADVLQALEKPLNEMCISRPRDRLEWGIPLPFDEKFVTYVWFDALVNYASWADWGKPESRWPADLHVIGKDILVPPHGIYWPIMLNALDIPLPGRLLVHGWWQNDGEKMSKSTGNVVDPLSLVESHGSDAFRYFVLRDMAVGYDADFTVEAFEQRYNSDLANDLGNLLNRTVSMIGRYRAGQVPSGCDTEMAAFAVETRDACGDHFEKFDVHRALERIWKLVGRANQFVEERAPWKLAKDPDAAPKLDIVLGTLAETLRILSILIEPVLPTSARRIQAQLGMATADFAWVHTEPSTRLIHSQVQKPEPLFPKLEDTEKK